MKTTKWFWLVGAGLFLTLNLLHAQTDSIVQVTAEAQGLGLVAAGDLPVNGTFWLMTSNSAPTPLPFMPGGGDFPVYDLTGEGTQFLVDETDGQAVTNDANSTVAAALAAQADAVVNLINQVQDAQDASLSHGMARAFGMDDGMDMMEDDDSSSGAMMYDTNGLWLELTNISNGWSYLNLHNGTNYVYAILSKTNLTDATWNVETELFPMGDQTNVLPFSVQNFDRQNLFLKAEDWTGVTENGNTTPDWWLWEYYGTTALSDTSLDSEGNTLAYDYTNGLVPVAFNFSGMEVANNYVNTLTPLVQLDVAGNPYYVAISVDDTNYENDANWQNYSSSNVTVNLGMTEGWHEVWIGLRGHGDDAASAVWWRRRLKLDWTPPQVTVTNNLTLDIPLLQLRGFANEDLAGISYDLSNAVVYVTNQDVNLTDRYYDTNTSGFTTNSFEALDIGLTNGVNVITIHATDDAGNVTVTNFSFTLDYSGKTNPPVFVLTWPTNGMSIAGSSFTLRGTVADPTVSVSASMVDTNGNTNAFAGLVERDGRFWLENVPLNSGTNTVSITLSDVVGNTSVTNISLVQSSLTLTMNPVADSSQLWQPTVNVSGTISDASYAVWVNGVQGTNNGDGTWSANNVPTSAGGVAIFDLTAYPPSEAPSGSLSGGSTVNPSAPDAVSVPGVGADKPVRLYVASYTLNPWHEINLDHENAYAPDGSLMSRNYNDADVTSTVDYQDGQPGGSHYSSGDFFWDYVWPASASAGGWPVVSWTWSDSLGEQDAGTDGLFGSYEVANNADISLGGYDVWSWDWYDGWWVDRTVKNTESYNAHTVMKLQTGGKAMPARQNLWRLSAGATQLYPGRYKPDGTTIDDVWTTVPAQNIQVDGKALGSDGNLWIALSDNQTVDVTPTVNNVSYYTFGISQQEYQMTPAANGTQLDPNMIVAGAKHAIGEKINLSPVFSPSLPEQPQETVLWSLPGTYINAFTVWTVDPETGVATIPYLDDENLYDSAYGLTDFKVDSAKLQWTNTYAWWQMGSTTGFQTETISVGMNLTFANGQQVVVTAKGLLGMHQPTVSWNSSKYGAGVVTGEKGIGYEAAAWYNVGLIEDAGGLGILMTADSQSLVPGRFGITQLVKRNCSTTGGSWSDWELDDTMPYNSDANQPYDFSISPPFGIAEPFLTDQPKVGDIGGVWSQDQFQDYFMFRADTPGSIWATVGTANWNWFGSIVWCTSCPDGWVFTEDPQFYCLQAISPSHQHPEFQKTHVKTN